MAVSGAVQASVQFPQFIRSTVDEYAVCFPRLGNDEHSCDARLPFGGTRMCFALVHSQLHRAVPLFLRTQLWARDHSLSLSPAPLTPLVLSPRVTFDCFLQKLHLYKMLFSGLAGEKWLS